MGQVLVVGHHWQPVPLLLLESICLLLLLQSQLLLKNGVKRRRGVEGGVDGLQPLLATALATGEVLEGVQHGLGILLLFLFADLGLLQQQFPAFGHSRELARVRVIADVDLGKVL